MENINNILNGELALNVRLKLNSVIERVNSLTNSVPEIITDINTINTSINQIIDNINDISTNIDNNNLSIDIISNNISLLQNEINNINIILNNNNSKFDSIENNVSLNTNEIGNINTNLISLSESITTLSNTIDNILNSIAKEEFGSIKLTNNPVIFNPFIGEETIFTKVDNGDEIDYIDVENNIAITRDIQRGIYNPLQEEEWNREESPKGTLWNNDGYDDFKNLPFRTYTTFSSSINNSIGRNILNSNLVMFVPATNKYYKIKFTSWTQNANGGGFSYIRQELNTNYYFNRLDNVFTIDTIDQDIQIARNENGWIYNPVFETEHNENSPTGTLWNNDGWNDLSNLLDRKFVPLYDIFDNNFRNIPNNELIMKDTINNKYYLFKFISWSRNNGGGFSYTRFLLNLNQLSEGIKFSDGTRQKTAITPLKSKAFGTWNIIEKTGFSDVNLTEFIIEEDFEGITVANPFINEREWDIFVNAQSYPLIVSSINEGNNTWVLTMNNIIYNVEAYTTIINNVNYIVFYNNTGEPVNYQEGDVFNIKRGEGGDPGNGGGGSIDEIKPDDKTKIED